ncbi:DUF4150 domain-containing protein [Uliginosibacterium sp. 31-16]|uniref:PAAR-like domain-containing protein n=1 Tax=Uliginosibacterium sp. 31-16 TaxID=3068315 RepID=UPI00273FE33F|nr:PAAR-like domain-containing protein [Uliginosibacterium sp. 31-16]MDP5240088.1 DUF4150 domain-containing protein [Uliginosibacterium sp. 31-16]
MMANQVFANMMEVSCKAANGKSVACFPDVCFTPPQTPATPPGVPIPYPNTGMASDTTKGSRTVKISSKEVMLKNKSYFKTSYGDEPGCAPKKGVVTSKNKGKVYFQKWSMNVMVEGENVVRMGDITTHNHGSVPGNTPTWPYIDGVAVDLDNPCVGDMKKEHAACKDCTPHKEGGINPCAGVDASLTSANDPTKVIKPGKDGVDDYAEKVAANDCLKARRCMLQPYDKTEKGKGGCCDGQTGHHLIEASGFMEGRTSNNPSILAETKYDPAKAPCVCVEGTNQYHGTHGLLHTYQSTSAVDTATPGSLSFVPMDDPKADPTLKKIEKTTTYGTAKKQALEAMEKVFPKECDSKCIEKQLDAYHNQAGISDDTKCKSVITGHHGDEWVAKADKKIAENAAKASKPSKKL